MYQEWLLRFDAGRPLEKLKFLTTAAEITYETDGRNAGLSVRIEVACDALALLDATQTHRDQR